MGRPRKFKGLSEVRGLSDAQAGELVLASWVTLHGTLMTRPSARELRRLLRLEWRGRRRRDLLLRLRRALNRAAAREALDALDALTRPKTIASAPRDVVARALG